MSEKTTQAMRDWLLFYRDGNQNGKPYPVNSVWTRMNGSTVRGVAACQRAGLITSQPDATINPRGWRHDITPAGRAALQPQEPGRG